MDYTYAYLIGSLVYLAIWTVLFVRRRDCRKEMFYISLLFGLAALVTAPVHLTSWWQPLTVTGTKIGIEDFLFGFAASGIASVLYVELFRKHLRRERYVRMGHGGLFFLAGFALLFFFFVHTLEQNAFYAVLYSYLIGIALIYWYRRDLARGSLVTGALLVLLSAVIYWVLLLPYPEVIREFWVLDGLWYHRLILGIPVEEYVFFFLTGAFVGPLYEFVTDRRLVAASRA